MGICRHALAGNTCGDIQKTLKIENLLENRQGGDTFRKGNKKSLVPDYRTGGPLVY